ncbi:MAG: hypothetical protein EP330_05945 [Deltaproteobacteria bacterium]|nr:MAG: hypothetical protein EP330_05945 [Deltaproteobacteria bacterium]
MTRLSRRGASAVEFALILPIFMVIVGGIVDYGHYFALQSQAMTALSGAMFAGTHVKPDGNDLRGECASCRSAVALHAKSALDNLGLEAELREVTPNIEKIQGTCALVLDVEVSHKRLVGLVPMPDRHAFSVNAPLLHVDDC